MERSEIASKIQAIVVRVLKHDRIEMHDELTASMVEGWDSLTHMTIISSIEKDFNIQFKLKDLNKLKNMGSLLDLVQSKL
jgi:acyl carrier protein